MIDFDNLYNLLQVFLPQQQNLFKKNIILFLGKTGAGKSTTINYLLGYPLKRGEEGQVLPATSDLTLPAEIGYTSEAFTIYPTLHSEENGLIYCDCPGFEDNRGPEVCIATTICMQATVNLANCVSSAVVVIDYVSLKAERGRGFKELAATLGQLLKNPSNKLDSLLFVINRAEEGITKESVLKRIAAIGEIEQGRLDKIQQAMQNSASTNINAMGIDIEKQKETVRILQFMQNSPECLVMLDIFDQGQSRNTILSILRKKQIFSNLLFDFTIIDLPTLNFQKFLMQKIEDFLRQSNHKDALIKLVKSIKAQKNENKATLKQLDRQLLEFASKKQIQKISDEYVEACNKLLNVYSTNIDSNKKLFQQLSQKLEALKQELAELDTTEAVFYEEVKDTFHDGFFRDTQDFYYNSISYVRAEAEYDHKAGTFEIETNKPQAGLYKATYKSNLFSSSIAHVRIYIEKNRKPENIVKIQALKEEISKFVKHQEQLENIIQENKTKHEELTTELQAYLKQEEEKQLTKRETLYTAKKFQQKAIEDLQLTLRNTKQQLVSLDKTLELQQPLLNKIYILADFLQFTFPHLQAIVKEFLVHYQSLFTNKAIKTQIEKIAPSKQTFFVLPTTFKVSLNDEKRSYSTPPRRNSELKNLDRDNDHEFNVKSTQRIQYNLRKN